MKRIFTFAALAVCLWTAQMTRAAEGRDTQIKAQMVENYLVWQEAYKNKDGERIISLEAPDFTSLNRNGDSTPKAQHDEGLREMFNGVDKVTNARIDIKKVSIERNRVVVWNKQYVSAEMAGNAGETNRLSFALSVKDIWVEYDGIWMLKRQEELSGTMTINGKTSPL